MLELHIDPEFRDFLESEARIAGGYWEFGSGGSALLFEMKGQS